MANITPSGSASVGNGSTILSFPLLPQGWPLSRAEKDGQLGLTPNQTAATNTQQQALVESSNQSNRLI